MALGGALPTVRMAIRGRGLDQVFAEPRVLEQAPHTFLEVRRLIGRLAHVREPRRWRGQDWNSGGQADAYRATYGREIGLVVPEDQDVGFSGEASGNVLDRQEAWFAASG